MLAGWIGEGVKRFSFEDLEVIEGREAEREVGDVLGADLAGHELLGPFQRGSLMPSASVTNAAPVPPDSTKGVTPLSSRAWWSSTPGPA